MRLSIATALSFLGLFACGSSAFSTSDAGPAPEEGGAGGDGAVPPPPNCDVSKLPTEDPCVVHEGVGVFVSASLGSAQGDGTRARPLASAQAGIDLAKQSGRRVYVCAETYKEQLALADGVSVFGYFDCAMGWSVGAKRATLAPTASPTARASGVQKPTRLEALDLVAPDGAMSSDSSIAFVAAASPGLRIVGSRLHAGKGADGASSTDAPSTSDSGAGKDGAAASGDYTCDPNNAGCSSGPVSSGGTNACTGQQTISAPAGGAGGDPGLRESVLHVNPYVWIWQTQSSSGSPGGANGGAGAAGMSGATGREVGKFDAQALYLTADGTLGTNGSPGAGGAGGDGDLTAAAEDPSTHRGYYHWGNIGGAGGAGGCPGFTTDAGGGGGASVALLAFDSPIALERSQLESGKGGAGGHAGFPSAPLAGGNGGAGKGFATAGGHGGMGGAAGVSGSGGGGPSFAVAFHGAMPVADAQTTLVPGSGGDGAAARSNGTYTIPASPSGIGRATYSF